MSCLKHAVPILQLVFLCVFFSMNMYFRSKNFKSIENFHQHSLTGSIIKVNLTLFCSTKDLRIEKLSLQFLSIHPAILLSGV